MLEPTLDLSPLELDGSPADAALQWLHFGYTPIPTLPGKKFSPKTWNAWSENLDEAKIKQHYTAYPEHEVACLTNDELIVFDADSDSALEALKSIEERFGIFPKLVVKTTRGIHHHFRRAGAVATQDSHDSAQHPERIDIRTGRSMIMMPPSGGRSIVSCEATCFQDLSIVTQEFIDAVFFHNGRNAPSTEADEPEEGSRPNSRVTLAQLKRLLDLLDPSMGYQDWLNVGMALYHETDGSSEGFSLFDGRSAGSTKYGGTKEIEVKWKSFKGSCSNPITVGTLVMLAKREASEAEVHAAMEEDFEPCPYEIVSPEGSSFPTQPSTTPETPFLRFSLRGKSEEIKKNVGEQSYVLEGIALRGQSTVIYAPPNSGKTLITLALLKNSIIKGLIDPSMVYYINVDDGANGLLEKNAIAEKCGFHMLSDAHSDFKTSAFPELIVESIAQKCVAGMVIILDTLKKFTDPTDKAKSSKFANLCTQFALHGGTIIALAHTNKNRGPNGTLIPGGTSDIVDDFHCVYVIDKIPSASEDTVAVEFSRLKGRGGVVQSLRVSYKKVAADTPYEEMFNSVEMLSDEKATEVERTAQRHKDAHIIAAISGSIRNGKSKKMELLKEVGSSTGASREAVGRVLDRYSGSDPGLHLWRAEKKAHGAQVFSLLADVPELSITSI